jgi:hypothetical protein
MDNEAKDALIAALRAENRALRAGLEDLADNVEIPDGDCSCHLSPPCADCVNYGGLRLAYEEARAFLKSAAL